MLLVFRIAVSNLTMSLTGGDSLAALTFFVLVFWCEAAVLVIAIRIMRITKLFTEEPYARKPNYLE